MTCYQVRVPLTCSVGTGTHSALMISSDTRRLIWRIEFIPKSGKNSARNIKPTTVWLLKPAELRTLWSSTSGNPQDIEDVGRRSDCGGRKQYVCSSVKSLSNHSHRSFRNHSLITHTSLKHLDTNTLTRHLNTDIRIVETTTREVPAESYYLEESGRSEL